MTPQQKALVQATIPLLRSSGVALTSHFYQRMFQHNPELKHLFNQGQQGSRRQQQALAAAVLAYAENLMTRACCCRWSSALPTNM